VIYLRVQDLEVKEGKLVLALQLQDLPQLRELLSDLGRQSGEDDRAPASRKTLTAEANPRATARVEAKER
jgi:hypothetical protein